jgi:hypothetical protein
VILLTDTVTGIKKKKKKKERKKKYYSERARNGVVERDIKTRYGWCLEGITTLTNMSLIGHILPPFPSTSKLSSTTKTSLCLQIPEATLQNPNPKPIFLSKLLSLALAATLSSPLPALAIPSLNSQSSLLPPTTPFSQSKNLELGLENGYVLNFFCSIKGFAFFFIIFIYLF